MCCACAWFSVVLCCPSRPVVRSLCRCVTADLMRRFPSRNVTRSEARFAREGPSFEPFSLAPKFLRVLLLFRRGAEPIAALLFFYPLVLGKVHVLSPLFLGLTIALHGFYQLSAAMASLTFKTSSSHFPRISSTVLRCSCNKTKLCTHKLLPCPPLAFPLPRARMLCV